MDTRRHRFLLLACLFLARGAAHAANVDVFPGPGTPLQDAIAAATPGDQLFLHAGTYTGPIVIDRALRLRPIDGPVTISTDCATDTVVDITAAGVRLIGPLASGGLGIGGGAVRAVRVAGQANVLMKYVYVSGCPGGTSVEVTDSADVRLTHSYISNALVGVAVRNSTRVKVTSVDIHVDQTGVQLEDIAPGTPLRGAKVSLKNLYLVVGEVTSVPPEFGVRFVNADGISVSGSFIAVNATTATCVDLDAGSDNNRIGGNRLRTDGTDIVDGGTGNLITNNQCYAPSLNGPCP